MKGPRDLIYNLPSDAKGLEGYVLKHYDHIREEIESREDGQEILERSAERTYDRFRPYLKSSLRKTATGISAAGHGVGHVADLSMLSGNVLGNLGGKAINAVLQLPDAAYGIYYGVSNGNYLSPFKTVFEKLASYFPMATSLDQGTERIIKKDMVTYNVRDLEKKLDIKPYRKENVVDPKEELAKQGAEQGDLALAP